MIYRSDFDYSIDYLKEIPSQNSDLSQFRIVPKDHVYTLGLPLTRRCNCNCKFCYYHQKSRIGGLKDSLSHEIDINLLSQILDSLPIMSCINISLEGEPFCHSQFAKCLHIIEQHTDKILLTTNGNLLNSSFIKMIKPFNIEIVLSLEYSDQDNYKFLRQSSSFINVCKSIELMNKHDINYVVYSILLKENLSSYLSFPKLARRLDIKNVLIGSLRQCPNSRANNLHTLTDDEILEYLPMLSNEFAIYGINAEFDSHFSKETLINLLTENGVNFAKENTIPDRFCGMPWFYTNILSDGKLFPCCGDFLPVEIEEFSFNAIFNNEYLLYLRMLLTANNIPVACLKCRNIINK